MRNGLRYSPTVFRLVPREQKFFDLFEQQGANIVAAARASRDEIESRRLAMEERGLRERKKALDAKAAAARKAAGP